MLRAITAALVVIFTSGSAYALEEIPGKAEFSGLLGKEQSEMAAGLMFKSIDGAMYLQINPRFDFRTGPFGFGIQVPLNLRVHPWDDEGKKKYGKQLVRGEDWDEVGDYLKLLRYIQYGEKRDFIYARLGELSGKLGHGTIVRGYSNTIDINTHRVGFAFDLNTDLGGFESMFSDLVSIMGGGIDSQLIAARGFVKPVGFWAPESALNIFSLGLSVATDLNAPFSVDADGDEEVDVDAEGEIAVAETKGVTIIGLDIEAEVLNNDIIEMIPYIDLNFVSGAGYGLHIGLDTKFKLPIGIDFQIPILLEYRHFASNYIPMYFDTFYEIERFSLAGQSVMPKGRYLLSEDSPLNDGEGINGVYGELGFDFMGLVTVAGKYEHYSKTDAEKAAEEAGLAAAEADPGTEFTPIGKGTFTLLLLVPALDVLQFEAYYRRTNITGADDIFKFDDRSMAVAQAKYQMYPFVYLVAQASRRWVFEEATVRADGTREAAGYQATDDWGVGVEFAYQF
ncbi:MAG: hypothetical protein HOK28_20445 [Deltaproteobacteria bacterium]|nr:hypothetical protein [Deltaproteobacteria bacterium]